MIYIEDRKRNHKKMMMLPAKIIACLMIVLLAIAQPMAATFASIASSVQMLPREVGGTGTIADLRWDKDRRGQHRKIVPGNPSNVIFVVDVSSSTIDHSLAGKVSVPDMNGDGRVNKILDVEIAALTTLNHDLIDRGLGEKTHVSVVVFGTRSMAVDLDPGTEGLQVALAPIADNNNNGIPDIEERLQAIQARAYGVGGYSNFEAALQEVEDLLQQEGTTAGKGVVVFLCDGYNNQGGSYSDEVSRLKGAKVKVTAFGIGEKASLKDLQRIDPQTQIFTTNDDIIKVFRGG